MSVMEQRLTDVDVRLQFLICDSFESMSSSQAATIII